MRGKRTSGRTRAIQPGVRQEQHPLLAMPDWVVINGIYNIGCLAWPALIIVSVRSAGYAIGTLLGRLSRRKDG